MASRIHCLEIPTPFPVGPVNIYLIEGKEPVLIDAGPNTLDFAPSTSHSAPGTSRLI